MHLRRITVGLIFCLMIVSGVNGKDDDDNNNRDDKDRDNEEEFDWDNWDYEDWPDDFNDNNLFDFLNFSPASLIGILVGLCLLCLLLLALPCLCLLGCLCPCFSCLGAGESSSLLGGGNSYGYI